jgi:hypothetical protein
MIKNFNDFINENKFVDDVLDRINSLGGFNNLSDIDKLALLTDTNNEKELKKLSLLKIFKENGGTFGRLMVKVRVKPIDEQPNDHRFSKQNADKEGYLYPYIHYSEDKEPYVTVRFDIFNEDDKMKGGGTYEEYPIMLANIYPIGYNKIKSDFVKYDQRIENDRKDFLDSLGFSDED